MFDISFKAWSRVTQEPPLNVDAKQVGTPDHLDSVGGAWLEAGAEAEMAHEGFAKMLLDSEDAC